MIDLNSKSALPERINYLLDSSLVLLNSFENKRTYLGGSRIGVECERALQYEVSQTPKDTDKKFNGRILKVFKRGHLLEEQTAEWIRQAGFGLLTANQNGKQFEFKIMDGKVAGHCDGIFISGPVSFGPYPKLWECKCLQEKTWKSLKKDKLKKSSPVYFAQVQFYMKHLNLVKNPALFCAVNANTMEIFWESIEYDENYVKGLDAKAIRVLNACETNEILPRFYPSKDFFKCKFCDWRKRCWAE